MAMYHLNPTTYESFADRKTPKAVTTPKTAASPRATVGRGATSPTLCNNTSLSISFFNNHKLIQGIPC